jgi:heat shock protein HslJ
MAFVKDLTYPDKNMTNPPKLYPGEEFQKGWRIKNTGTCPWDITYSLVYVDGNTPAALMGGQPTAVNAKVQPGALYDMYVNLVAPLQPGVYQGFWQMRNPQGVYFGDRIWVGIQVVSLTPQPTTIPQPVIQRFSADPAQVNVGGCVLVQWEVLGNISNIKILRDNTTIWSNAPFTGSMSDCPQNPGQVLYQIEAAGPGGTSLASRPVNVVGTQPTAVSTPTQPPAQPTATQPPPPTATQPPPPTATQPPPPTATQPPPTPELPANTPTSEPVPPTVAPQPTPPPAPPVINSFVIQPNQVKVGECVNGSWSVSGDVQSVRILRNDKVIADNAPMTGNGQDCFQNSGTEVYTLEAVGADGKSVTQQQTVTVNTADTSLVLVSYLDNQGQQASVLPGTKITAVLGANNSLTGSAGCNTYSTTYRVNGSTLTIAPTATGQVMCSDPQGIMEQEQAYLAALTRVNSFQVAGDTVKLTMKYVDPADNIEKVSVLLVFQLAR